MLLVANPMVAVCQLASCMAAVKSASRRAVMLQLAWHVPVQVMIWDDHQAKCIGELSFRSQV
jgi:hypothetical protein